MNKEVGAFLNGWFNPNKYMRIIFDEKILTQFHQGAVKATRSVHVIDAPNNPVPLQ